MIGVLWKERCWRWFFVLVLVVMHIGGVGLKGSKICGVAASEQEVWVTAGPFPRRGVMGTRARALFVAGNGFWDFPAAISDYLSQKLSTEIASLQSWHWFFSLVCGFGLFFSWRSSGFIGQKLGRNEARLAGSASLRLADGVGFLPSETASGSQGLRTALLRRGGTSETQLCLIVVFSNIRLLQISMFLIPCWSLH